MRWEATRADTRTLPTPYPRADSTRTTDFPPLATLTTTVTFPAVAADADLWLLLSSTPCGLQFSCTPSRTKRVSVRAGASSADVVVTQLHHGRYSANVILDRDRNMATTLTPTSGDGAAALDSEVVVAGIDDVAIRLPIVFTIP